MDHRVVLGLAVVACGLVGTLARATASGAAASDLFADEAALVFEHLTIDDGLPENSVRAMVQDRTGFLWLGTQNGLVRYDGHEMVVHTPDPGVPGSFGGRTVEALWEDASGDIWIGTFLSGLWRYDGRLGRFHRIRLLRDDGPEPLHVYDVRGDGEGRAWVATEGGLFSVDVAEERVEAFTAVRPVNADGDAVGVLAAMPDAQGRIWCATDGQGLAHFVPETGAVRWFRHAPDRPRGLPSDIVYDLHRDPQDRIWIATAAGLALWQETEEAFTTFLAAPGTASEVGPNFFICLASDPRGLLWAGAATGLYVFGPDRGRFRFFPHDPDDLRSPVNGPILSVLVDRGGLVWAGSWHTGLNKVDPSAGRYRVRRFALPEADLPSAAVEAVATDRRGGLWVAVGEKPRGAGRGRIYLREAEGREFRPVLARSALGRILEAGKSILETPDGTILVGTQRGLWQLQDEVLVPLAEVRTDLSGPLDQGSIKDMAVDREGRLWVATWSGLVRWDFPDGPARVYRHGAGEHALGGNDPVVVHVDRAGRVWIGFDSRGLNLYRPETDDFRRFFEPERGLETVSDIHEDDAGVLWLATFAGLVRFDPATGETRIFGRKDGIPNDQISAVAGDGEGLLWLATGYGIASFDPRTLETRSYDTRDGLPDHEVKFARITDREGWIHFGGASGLVSFLPRSFARAGAPPPVVVTDVAVDDLSLEVGPDAPLGVLPHLATGVVLRHDRNDVSFGFAALDFGRPDQNRFLYRLEGADDVWRNPGPARRASYTNLQPGRYVFQVRGSNREGLWNEVPATMALRILPPWWRTIWAYGVYVLLIGLLLWFVVRQLTNRERMRASLELQRAEASKLQELDELKTRFLTNITHEFRTPLTLIKVPLQRLREEQAGHPDQRLDTMLRNTARLEELIDQVLDLSRLEAGRLPLNWRHGDCLSVLRVFLAGFESLAAQRDIELMLRFSDEECAVWHDKDVLEKLVGNLMTNALKHTPDGGRVVAAMGIGAAKTVPAPAARGAVADAKVQARDLVVAVTNTGSFIAEEDRGRVFDRFYQVSGARGSGVGLSLVKELAEWLGGHVDVVSDPVGGTCFTVVLPVYLEHPEGDDDFAQDDTGPASATVAVGAEEDEDDAAEEVGSGPPRVLVVEDSADLRQFMADDLQPEFEVFQAANGEQGLAIARAEIPDLVLSDVMMPGMDGFELCRNLKEDERTSHVPVILLTARSETESRHEGLRLGADDYLAKPFDAEDLRLRIRNLVEQRRKLAAAYERRLAVLSPEAMPVTSADERFIVQLRHAIDAHLDDPEFRINELCREVGMSRSQLHRKLTAVTGKTTSDFVRTHRLQRAAQLFDGGYGNVTEVAYAVGFRNLSYFARCFRDLYGQHPSEYLRARSRG